jgi:hypothetical protein
MARKHIFILVVILGAAVLSGLVAMARTTGVGTNANAAPTAASPALEARLRHLARFEKRLEMQLAKEPAGAALSSSAGQSTVYVPSTSTSAQDLHPSSSDDGLGDEHEDEGGDE